MDLSKLAQAVQEKFSSYADPIQKKLQKDSKYYGEITGRFKSFLAKPEIRANYLNDLSQTLTTPVVKITDNIDVEPIRQRFDQWTNEAMSIIKPHPLTPEVENRFNELNNRGQKIIDQVYSHPSVTGALSISAIMPNIANDFAKNTLKSWWEGFTVGSPEDRELSSLSYKRYNQTINNDEIKRYNKLFQDKAMNLVMATTINSPTASVPAAGEKLSAKIGSEKALDWILNYQNILKKYGVPDSVLKMDARAAYEWTVKNAPKALKQIGVSPGGTFDAFKAWVNGRRAAEFTGIVDKRPFTELDSKGVGGFLEFQAGNKSGLFGKLKGFFDQKYKQALADGLKMNYKNEYLPQLWANPEAADTTFKSLGRKPSFTLESVLKDYETGIRLGLEPRFKKVSDLVGWYSQNLEKVMADRKFFDFLETNKLILPAGKGLDKAPRDWQVITAEGFPRISNPDGDIYYKAPPKIAQAINNYLENPENILSKIANFTTSVKNIGLSAGVPGTAINAHGWNIWARSWVSAKNPLSQILTSTKWMIRPSTAEKFVDLHLKEAIPFVKAGMTMSVEDVAYTRATKEIEGNILQKGLAHLSSWYDEAFSTPLFNKVVPAAKINYAQSLYNDLIKHMTPEEALNTAAHQANTVFGGINIEELARDKNTQNLFRSIILAPDWLESTGQIARGVGTALLNPKDPKGRAFLTIARNTVAYYVLANVINKVSSGHWMFENEGTSNKFFIDTGTQDATGKERYFRPGGTALDFARLPAEIALSAASGDLSNFGRTIANRLSMPAGAALHLLSNKDYMGRNITGGNLTVGQQLANVGNEALSGFGVPSQLRAGIDLASGRSSPEQFLTQVTELPIRYQSTGNKNVSSGIIDNVYSYLFGQKAKSVDPVVAAFQKEALQDKNNKKIRDIFAAGESKEAINKRLLKEGLGSYDEAAITIMKSLQTETRANLIRQLVRGKTNNQKRDIFLSLAGKKVLTNAVVNQWQDDNLISEVQVKSLKLAIAKATGSYRNPKPKKVTIPKFGGTPIRAPKIETVIGSRVPRLQPVKLPRFKTL